MIGFGNWEKGRKFEERDSFMRNMERIGYCIVINEALPLKKEKKKEERNDPGLALVDQAKIRASFTVLLGFCSRMVIYIRVLSPLFFHRREISDEIRMNTRSSKGGEGARYRGRRAKHRETRYSKILTREIYIHMYGISSPFADHRNTEVRPLFIFLREKAICIPVVETGFLLSGCKREEKKKRISL